MEHVLKIAPCAAAIATTTLFIHASPAVASSDFRWIVPSSATVVEDVEKNGRQAKLQYRLSVTRRTSKPSAKMKQLVIGHSQFRFLELPGADLTDPKVKAVAKKIERQASAAIPVILVAPGSGRFVGVLGLGEALQRLQKLGALSKEDVVELKGQLGNANIRAAVEDEARNVWLCFAGAWRELKLPIKKSISRVDKLDVFGAKIPVDVRIEQRKITDSTVTLRFDGRVPRAKSGPFLKAYNRWMKTLGAPVDNSLSAVTVRYSCEATLDRKTLMPQWVERRDEVTMHHRDGDKAKPTVVKNRHTYRFRWERK